MGDPESRKESRDGGNPQRAALCETSKGEEGMTAYEQREIELHAAKMAEFADCQKTRESQRADLELAQKYREKWEEVNLEVIGALRRQAPLSFRDQCAIAAIHTIDSDLTVEFLATELLIGKSEYNPRIYGPMYIAQHAFDVADAMEAERQKRNHHETKN